ncbi:MAG: Nudix family hydrolase [Gammaproteobacteria bacterium]|nr:Nudix family hydrolase [Gammaproteobacteria bacterium]
MDEHLNHQHVVAAAIFNKQGEVLLALRPAHLHQGGLWEFPGGKIEADEDVRTALARELHEELGITVTRARPLIRIPHRYPDKAVLLDVWRVDDFAGEAHGREDQRLEWVAVNRLRDKSYPAANLPVITALELPSLYLISEEPATYRDVLVSREAGCRERPDPAAFLATLEAWLKNGARLIQLRAKTLDEDAYAALAVNALTLCKHYNAELLLNAPVQIVMELGAPGIHMSSAQLLGFETRPVGKEKRVAASCHTAAELAHALAIGVDFVVVSPVLPTTSHPGAATLGWTGLRALTEQATVPVYALGGMQPEHLDPAWQYGAQGIAVRGVWPSVKPAEFMAHFQSRYS